MRLQLKQKQVDLRLRIITVSGAQEEARRNSVEMETNKDQSNSCDVSVSCDDVRCFLSTVLELNLCCGICISRGLI